MKHSCPNCDHEVSFFDVVEIGICPGCGTHFSDEKKRIAFETVKQTPSDDVLGAAFFLWFIHLLLPPTVGLLAASSKNQFDVALGYTCGFCTAALTTLLLAYHCRNSKRLVLTVVLAVTLGFLITGIVVFAGCARAVWGTT